MAEQNPQENPIVDQTKEILSPTPIRTIAPESIQVPSEIPDPNSQEMAKNAPKEVEEKPASSSSDITEKVKEWKKRKAEKLELEVSEVKEEDEEVQEEAGDEKEGEG